MTTGPSISPQPREKEKVTLIQIEDLAGSLDMYRLDTNTYPISDIGLTALVDNLDNNHKWKGPYRRKKIIPKDSWGNDFYYISSNIWK